MKIVFFFLILFISSGILPAVASNISFVDSLYHLGISKTSFDLQLSKNCAQQISEISNLSYVDKAHLNYLIYKIGQKELQLGGNNQSSIHNVEAVNVKNVETEWQRGVRLVNTGEVEEGLSALYDILKGNNPALSDSILCYVELNVAYGLSLNLEYSKAMEHYASIIRRPNPKPYYVALAFKGMAEVYDNMQNLTYAERFDSVKKYSLKSLEIAEENDLTGIVAACQNQLASIYRLDSRDLDSAQYYADLAFHNFINDGALRSAMNNSIILSDILIRRGNIKNALNPIEQMHDLLLFSGNEDLFLRIYLQMAKIYELLHQYREAYEFLSVGRLLQEKTFQANMHLQISELSAKYNLAVKEASILQQQQKIDQQKDRIKYLVLIFIVSFLVLASFLLILSHRKHQLEHRYQIDRISKEKMKMLLENRNLELSRLLANNIEKNRILRQLKKELSSGIDQHEFLQLLNVNIDTEQNWKKVLLDFNELYPNFTVRLSAEHPNLSQNDIKLCILLQLKMTSLEIAQMLSVSVAAVNKGRQRLRKKLELSGEKDLIEYLRSICLLKNEQLN
ncbi:MAG: helix-turn-helix transcriptional regulator [Prolixibacteraceae bacterium]